MNTTTTQTSTLHRLQQRLAESRFLSFSLLIHAILITIAGTYIITHREPPPEVMSGEVAIPASTTEEPEASVEEGPKELAFIEPTPSALPPLKSDTPEWICALGGVPMPLPRPPTFGDLKGAIIPPLPIPTSTPRNVPAVLSLRFGKDSAGRILMGTMGKPGPTKASEDAVLRGLVWLRDHQSPDGSWGERNKGAMTGLALLCFLGHGELDDSPMFGLNVNRGVQWLIDQGTLHEGRLSMTDADWGPGNSGVYEHAIATYALGEYLTMSKDARVLEVFRKAVKYIVEGQGPDGGWMYHFDKTQGDTSVSGWQVQALKAAHLTELNLPGVDTALDRAMEHFERVRGPSGGYGYRGPEDRYSLTGVGVLCQLFWGGKKTADLRRSVDFIRDQSAVQFPVKYQHEKADLYAWYYHTQAMLMFGGTAWLDWNKKFQEEVVHAQTQDGSWPAMKAPGHGNLQSDPSTTATAYRTALGVLMLEVYYRYMPTQRAEVSGESLKFAAR